MYRRREAYAHTHTSVAAWRLDAGLLNGLEPSDRVLAPKELKTPLQGRAFKTCVDLGIFFIYLPIIFAVVAIWATLSKHLPLSNLDFGKGRECAKVTHYVYTQPRSADKILKREFVAVHSSSRLLLLPCALAIRDPFPLSTATTHAQRDPAEIGSFLRVVFLFHRA